MATRSTPKMLGQRLISTTASSVLYTVPTGVTRAHIRTLIVCNLSNGAKTYSIWINQNGTQAADQFAVVKDKSISANTDEARVYSDDFGIILGSGASIIVSASVINTLTFTCFGLEIEEF